MIGNYIPWSGYEPYIRHCNARTVNISTHLHVAIMFTDDQKRRQQLIKWMDRMDAFTSIVRRSLIQLHRGEYLNPIEKVNIEKFYIVLVSAIEESPDKNYLEQFEPELAQIMNIFLTALKKA